MTTSDLTKKFFLNKKFYLYVKRTAQCHVDKTCELVKLFGGQIEQFLDNSVSYVLTDLPKTEWPPDGQETGLRLAHSLGVKLMSLSDLTMFCSKYINSQSSSDDDDEAKASIKELHPPYIKFEDYNCFYAPSVREFAHWPELKLAPFNSQGYKNLPVGKSFFNDNANSESGSTTQVNNDVINNNNPLHNNTNQFKVIHRGVKRKHSVHCEICNQKINEKIEDHIKTPAHRANTERLNWKDVSSVIDTLPSLSTLNMRRLTNLTPPNRLEHQEFLCLHKVESVSQLFFNSNKDQRTSSIPLRTQQ